MAKSLTWDLGHEMAQHRRFTIATGVQVYFCDPTSPWQRGRNENTNGLLRHYLPRRPDFPTLTQSDLDAIAQGAQRASSTDADVQDTITGTSRGVALTA